jgi:hypothetical protein
MTEAADDEGPPTNLFGFARGELPGEVDAWFWKSGGPEAVAREVIAQWKKWAAHHKIGSRRLDGGQLTELAAIAGMLTGYYSRLRLAQPQIVTEAIMTILGLIGENKNPSSLPDIMLQMKLPVVDDIEKFRRAALLDGEADAISLGLTAGFSTPFDVEPLTPANWVKRKRDSETWMKLRKKPDRNLAMSSDWECEELAPIDWSSKSELSANFLAAVCKATEAYRIDVWAHHAPLERAVGAYRRKATHIAASYIQTVCPCDAVGESGE